MDYTLHHQLTDDFEDAVERTIDALEEEGFGVLCDIDIQATFAKRLDLKYRNYRVFGACNPPTGVPRTRRRDRTWGALLCNVIVYELTMVTS